MVRRSAWLFFAAFLLSQVVSAQVVIQASGTGFTTYTQVFNSDKTPALPKNNGTSGLWSNGNLDAGSQSTIPGWYLGVEGMRVSSFYFYANDGVYSNAATYSYGANTAIDRSVGLKGAPGIQATLYAALRMRNLSGKNIKDGEIKYAIEQWYYGGDQTDVDLEYAIGPNVISPTTTSVTWYPLHVIKTPAIGTAIGRRDGNAAANRVARTFTLSNVKLPNGQEIVFRWVVRLTKDRVKVNGLSLDDVTITPRGTVTDAELPKPTLTYYYNKGNGDLDNTRTWGTNAADGSGTSPRNFTDPYQVFVIKNIDTGKTGEKEKYREDNFTLKIKSKDGWVISGEGAKLILGNGTPIKMAIGKDKFYTGPLDLAANATLVINTDKRIYNKMPTFGALDASSTVVYSDSTNMDIANTMYGNLVVLGNDYTQKQQISYNVLTASTSIKGVLALDGKKMHLSDKVLEIGSQGSVANAGPASYLITDGGGKLRMTLAGDGEALFPVGTADYTPVKIKMKAVAQTYEVMVKDGVQNGLNSSVTTATAAVKKTWSISKEDNLQAGASTMVLQWSAADNEGVLNPQAMYVGQYNATRGQWDVKAADAFAQNPDGTYSLTFTDNFEETGSTTGLRVSKQSNMRVAALASRQVAAMSPTREYTVFSRDPSALPVELKYFSAAYSNGTTTLSWSTATEKNNAYFAIDYSTDGTTYSEVGRVNGKGNSSKTSNYNFKHQLHIAGTIYYRLRQVDTDGTEALSKVVVVEVAAALQQKMTPNPTQGRITLELPALNQQMKLTVLNMNGVVIKQEQLQQAARVLELDLTSQHAGTYILRLQTPSQVLTYKLLKL